MGTAMEITILREFVSLAETLNFSTTAKNLFITQSTLSRHITTLENELGCALFDRTSRRVSLTSEGGVFYEDAKHIVGSTDAAISRIADMRARAKAPLRVGYLYDATSRVVVSLLSWLKENAPGIRPEFTCLEYGYLMRALMERDIDLALTMDIDSEARAVYDSFELYRDCYYLGVSLDSPLASRASVSIDEIRALDNLIFPDKNVVLASYTQFRSIIGDESDLNIVSYYRDLRTLLLQIKYGDGVALVAGHHNLCRDSEMRLIPISDSEICFPVSAMWYKNVAPAYQELFKRMRDVFAMKGGKPAKAIRDSMNTM